MHIFVYIQKLLTCLKNENYLDGPKKNRKKEATSFLTLHESYTSRVDYGTIIAPPLPEIKFNSAGRGNNYGKGLFAHARGLLICLSVCGNCGRNVHSFPVERDETPNPWNQQHTPNPPLNIDKNNVYCVCGNVNCYLCRPLYDYANNIIDVSKTTQQERTSGLCLWCKSFPATAKASQKVCRNIIQNVEIH